MWRKSTAFRQLRNVLTQHERSQTTPLPSPGWTTKVGVVMCALRTEKEKCSPASFMIRWTLNSAGSASAAVISANG
jgi:hypothetical protein